MSRVRSRPEELPPRPLRHHLALTIYWLGNTVMWGALLHLAIQSRLSDWYGEGRVGYYLGLLGCAGGAIGAATQIIAGAFSDRSANRWGRRRPYVVVGSLTAVLGLLLLGEARTFALFAAALLLVQFFTNLSLGPFTALLPDTVHPREHGKASGFMGVARLAGDTGGFVLASLLLSVNPSVRQAGAAAIAAAHQVGMLRLCELSAGLILVAMLITVVTIKERPRPPRPEASVRQIVLGSFAVDWRAHRDFVWLSLSRAVTNIGFYMFLEVLLYFLKYTLKDPTPEATSRLILLPAIGAAIVTSVVSGMLSDRLGRRPLVFAAQFIMTGAAMLFAVAPGLPLAIAAAIPAGLAFGIFTAVEWAFACNLLPPGEAGRYLGIWNASAVVPQVIAFPIAGALGSALSAYRTGIGWRLDFAVAAACCLLGAAALRRVRERRS